MNSINSPSTTYKFCWEVSMQKQGGLITGNECHVTSNNNGVGVISFACQKI
jgi:hypothetical protein